MTHRNMLIAASHMKIRFRRTSVLIIPFLPVYVLTDQSVAKLVFLRPYFSF
jgi:hypothetical protein